MTLHSNEDLILRAIDVLSEVNPEPGFQTLALIEALAALGRVAKSMGIEFAQGHVAGVSLALTKPRKDKVK